MLPVFLRSARSFSVSASQERTAEWMEGGVGGEEPERQDAAQAGFMPVSPVCLHRAPPLFKCSAVTALKLLIIS